MSILVTGGAGYIGSHTVCELLDAGHKVIVADNLSKGHRAAVPEDVALHVGDIRDGAFLDSVFSGSDIDGVIHFAAFSLVGESVTVPFLYYDNNVCGTLSLLAKMQEYGVKNIVFSSTAATYGEPDRSPIDEEAPNRPTNPYGETKLAVEKMLKWADGAYGIKSVCLRYFNAAGAHAGGRIGEDHTPESHLIPIIMQTALGQRDSLKIFGDDYNTADGTCIRDYVHVTDLSSAHVLAIESLQNGGGSAIYNLGNGKGFSVLEVLECARRVTGREIRADMGTRRAGDPAVLVASSDRIKAELGWKPRLDALETIVESAWRWHRDHPNGFDDK